MMVVPGIVISSKGEPQSIVIVFVVITESVVDCIDIVCRVVELVVVIGVVGLLAIVWVVEEVVVKMAISD